MNFESILTEQKITRIILNAVLFTDTPKMTNWRIFKKVKKTDNNRVKITLYLDRVAKYLSGGTTG